MQDEARRDETMRRTFQIKKPAGGVFDVAVVFYPNRVDMLPTKIEGEDDERSSGDRTNLRAATIFCDYVAEWDMTGPWTVNGELVADDGEMIPLSVPVIRSCAAWLISQITTKIMETVFPNLRRLQELQRQ